MMYPKFALAEFSVKDEAMNPSLALPAFVDHHKMVTILTDNETAGDAILQ